MKCVTFFIAFLLYSTVGFSQNPVYYTVNTLNGMPSNTVYHLLQDKQGFIWIGHDKGLSKYDGQSFVNYQSPSKQGKSLSYLIDVENTIWCKDFAGNFYYTKNNLLQKEQQLNNSGAFKTGIINHAIISINNDSINAFDINNHSKKTWKIPFNNISAVYFNSNELLFVNNNNLYGFDGKKIYSAQVFDQNKKTFFFLQKVNNEVYGFTKNIYPYVNLLNYKKPTPINVLKEGLFIQDVCLIDDEIWISTSTGAYCFNKQWQPKYNGQCFFEKNSITKIIKDREGNYWFGTLNKGIIIVPNINVILYKFYDEGITALVEDGKHILAGTSNHRILSFSTNKKLFTCLYKEKSNHEVLYLFNDKQKQQTIFCSDRIAILKNNKKISEQLTAGKSITKINENYYAMAYSSGIALLKSGANKSATPQWLTQSNTIWQNNLYNLLNINARGRCVFFNERDSTLFAATTIGLFCYSPKGKNKISCAGKDIFASQISKVNNDIYFATYSDGLYKLTNNNQAEKINNKNILSSLYKLQSTKSSLWMLGDEVLQEYNTTTNTIFNYTYAKGLPKAEFKDVLLKDDKVFLATTEGLVVFEQANITTNKIAPILAINNFFVNKQTTSWQQPLNLSSNQNDIEINFSLLSFKSSSNTALVQYNINNNGWQNIANNSRLLTLPSLSYGKYTITLRAFNEDGIQTEKDTIFIFSIAAPFYKQLWFVIFIVLAAMAIVYIFFQIRLKNITQKNQLLSQKIQLEQELHQSMLASIKSQMNPHFLYNALNTIQSYIYTNDKENASHYLGKFSQLTRLILEMSNKEIVAIAEEIKALQLYLELEQLRFKDKLVFELQIDDAISTETVYIPSMLIQPYIENAVKHGLLHKKNNWILNIHFLKKEGGVFVTIDDNGIGRKRSGELNKNKAKHHQSFASDANKKRLEILNKGLQKNIALEIIDKLDTNGNAAGTTVNLFIPFQMAKPTTYPKFY